MGLPVVKKPWLLAKNALPSANYQVQCQLQFILKAYQPSEIVI
jgi:hypothetical protein